MTEKLFNNQFEQKNSTEIKLEDVGMSLQLQSFLDTNNIHTLGDLYNKKDEILETPACSPKIKNEALIILAENKFIEFPKTEERSEAGKRRTPIRKL
jgi:hypothetical protein